MFYTPGQTAHLPIESENSATGEVVEFENDDTASPFEEKTNVENIIIRGGAFVNEIICYKPIFGKKKIIISFSQSKY